MKILVVDDEASILETAQHNLQRAGYTVITAADADEALKRFHQTPPDLIVLDVMLPGRSGFDLCQMFRAESQVPIIFLTAKGTEDDRVKGLELGADDYMVKPFSMRELVARVKTILRRTHDDKSDKAIKVRDIVIDTVKHQVKKGGASVELTPKEFALLLLFAQNAERVLSRDTLLDRVWGADAYVGLRTVDVHVRWLRSKLEDDPDNPERFITVRGIGYKFSP